MSKIKTIKVDKVKVILKLSTPKKGDKCFKIELYTKLSTLSTNFDVENVDLHNLERNKCFVYK